MFYFIPQNAAFTSSRTAVKERAMNAGTYFTNNNNIIILKIRLK